MMAIQVKSVHVTKFWKSVTSRMVVEFMKESKEDCSLLMINR